MTGTEEKISRRSFLKYTVAGITIAATAVVSAVYPAYIPKPVVTTSEITQASTPTKATTTQTTTTATTETTPTTTQTTTTAATTATTTTQAAKAASYKIEIDLEKCIGCGVCNALDSAHFDWKNGDPKASVRGGTKNGKSVGSFTDDKIDAAKMVAEACAQKAITITVT